MIVDATCCRLSHSHSAKTYICIHLYKVELSNCCWFGTCSLWATATKQWWSGHWQVFYHVCLARASIKLTNYRFTLCWLCNSEDADWIMTSLHQTISVTLLVVLLPFGEMLNVKKGSKMPWNQQKCTALENHEVYTSMKVAIGNPPQNFDLVADTGSDNCIVYDCSCKECPDAWGSCFTGPARSNSFKLPMFKVRQKGSERVREGLGLRIYSSIIIHQ